MKKIDWAKKLCSRKFWLAVVAFLTNLFVLIGLPDSVTTQICTTIMSGAVIVAYIIGEGMVDAASAADSDDKIWMTARQALDLLQSEAEAEENEELRRIL